MPTRPPSSRPGRKAGAPAARAAKPSAPSKRASPGRSDEPALWEIASRLARTERLAASLEKRAARLELALVDRLRYTPAPLHAKEGRAEGRTARARAGAKGAKAGSTRCPGCGLSTSEPLERCPYCRFLFSVLPPSQRPGRRAPTKGARSR